MFISDNDINKKHQQTASRQTSAPVREVMHIYDLQHMNAVLNNKDASEAEVEYAFKTACATMGRLPRIQTQTPMQSPRPMNWRSTAFFPSLRRYIFQNNILVLFKKNWTRIMNNEVTMKTLILICFSILISVCCANTGQAKSCDEVLYVAYDGGLQIRQGDPRPNPMFAQVDTIPYYFGAFCIDAINRKLTYYPRVEGHRLNSDAFDAADEINDNSKQEIRLKYWDKSLKTEEGRTSDDGRYFYAPLNTKRFSYWVGEYIGERVGKIIRRDVNAEPELDWIPNFTYSKPFTSFLFGNVPLPNFAWTDDKGRSGP